MSKNNCNNCFQDCESEDPCCPDEVLEGSAIDVRGRNCEVRRLIPGNKGLLNARQGRVQFSDGSENEPIYTNLPYYTAQDGVLVVQAADGQWKGIRPSDNGVYDLVYDGGSFRFSPKGETSSLFSEQSIGAVSTGYLVSFGCSSNGMIRLSRFQPDVGGTKFLLIQPDGSVVPSTYDFDRCDDYPVESSLDSLVGCKGNFKSRMALEPGEFLKADEDGKLVGAVLEPGLKMPLSPAVAYSYNGVHAVNNGTYNLATYSVPADATAVIVRVQMASWVTSGDSLTVGYNLHINSERVGRLLHSMSSYDGDAMVGEFLIKMPNDGVLNFAGTPHTATNRAQVSIQVDVKGYFV